MLVPRQFVLFLCLSEVLSDECMLKIQDVEDVHFKWFYVQVYVVRFTISVLCSTFFFFLMLFVGQSFADFACKETYKEGVLNLWNLKLMLLCKSALPRYSYLGST